MSLDRKLREKYTGFGRAFDTFWSRMLVISPLHGSAKFCTTPQLCNPPAIKVLHLNALHRHRHATEKFPNLTMEVVH